MTRNRIQWLFAVLTLLLVVLAVEVCSLLLLSLASGAWTPPTRVRAQQQQVADASDDADRVERAIETANENAPPAPQRVGSETIHPYLGFVLDGSFHRRLRVERGGREAVDFGLALTEPGLFHEPSASRR